MFLKKKLQKYLKDDFIRNNVIFFIGSMVISVINYLYHPILGRILSIEDFGEVQTLISIFLQFGVITGVFTLITVNISANIEDKKERIKIISEIKKIAFIVIGAIFLLFVILHNQLKEYLQFESFWPFLSLSVILLLSIDFSFRKAYLQGISDFKALSWSGIIFSASRLIFAVIFVYLGWRSFGAITGLVVAQIICLGYVFVKTKDDFKYKDKLDKSVLADGQIKDQIKYGMLIFMANLFITFLYTADVVLVKYFFTPTEAGYYSGVATIARIIFFATGSIAGVLLPTIKIKNSFKENFKILNKALLFMSIIGGGALIVFYSFPELIIKLLIGKDYLLAATMLGRLSILLFLVSLVNLFFYFYIALRKYILIPIAFIGIIFIVVSVFVFHNSIEQIINSFIYGAILVIVLLIINLSLNLRTNK